MALIACTGCKRHVRHELCPFCGTHNELPAAAPPRPTAKLTRSALVLGAALGLAGCSSATGTTDAGSGTDGGGSSIDGGGGGTDGGSMGTDSGSPADGGHDAGPIAAYGGPPLNDAGHDSGGLAPAYGAPPAP